MVAIGFDVGGTNVRGVVLERNSAEPLATRRSKTEADGDVLVDTIVEVATALMEDMSIIDPSATLEAVGLGMAALMDANGIFRYAPNIPGVTDYPLVERVSERLGVLVIADNDATTATWAEAKYGAGVGHDDLAFVALGTGIGTGFVLGGRLHRGANGYAGESGHITIDRHGPEHITGAKGPWEYYASGTGLGALARQWSGAGRLDAAVELAGSIEDVRGEHVNELVNAGHESVIPLIEEFADSVAIGMADLVYILDPSIIVLGGGLVDLGEPLRVAVEASLAGRILGRQHRPEVPVVLAELGPRAGAIGAGVLAFAGLDS